MSDRSHDRPASAVVCSIRTPRLLLRPYHPSDAPQLCRLIAGCLDHLQRWMDWAKAEPESVEAKAQRLREMRRSAFAGRTMGFGMFTADESEIIGSIGTHPRIGAGAREIGYWVGAAHARQGYTSEAAAAWVRVGFELQGLWRMEIHTDPENLASVGVARKIGFHHQVVVRNCLLSPTSPVRDTTIWTMLREDYAASPAARQPMQAFDRRGQRLM